MMANGTDAKEKLLAKVRPGLKREFEFAFRAHSEICGGGSPVMGRTRSNRYHASPVLTPNPSKRSKSGVAGGASEGKEGGGGGEEEAKSDVLELGSGDEEAQVGVIELVRFSGPQKEAVRGGGEGECVGRSNGSVAESGVDDGLGEKRVLVAGEANGSVEKNSDGEVKEFGKGNMCEEGTNGLSSVSAVVNGGWAGSDGGSIGKVEGKPFRRFTRSALKVKMEAEKDGAKSGDGGLGEENVPVSGQQKEAESGGGEGECARRSNGSVVDLGVDEGLGERRVLVAGLASGSVEKNSDGEVKEVGKGNVCEEGTSGLSSVSIVVNGGWAGSGGGSIGKVEEKLVRRFTRSALKLKMEAEKDGTESGNGGLGEEKIISVDDSGSSSAGTNTAAASNASFYQMSKNDMHKQFPSKLKDLLESGILEGAKVKYYRRSKARVSGGAALEGVIKGSNILCFCHECKGKDAVTPAAFELHAGSPNKRPPEYIYLENGNSLRDVMKACKAATVETMDKAVRISIGLSLKKPNFCLNCKGSMVGTRKSMLCNTCLELKESQSSSPGRRDTKKGSAEKLVVSKSSGSISKSSASQSKSQGKLTRKDLRLHKLVFEEDILPDGTEVAYFAKGKKLLVGYKKGLGIVCSCCNTEISPSLFEAHAGWASRRKPYLHIYTSNGVSLHELSISLSKSRKLSTRENDDLCQICRDGGALICCDGCPRSFHKECLHLPGIPKDEFFCKFCLNARHLEKNMEGNADAIAAGRVAGVDPIEQITRRCMRIVKVPGADIGGCTLCRDPGFEKGFGPRTVILCDQCEREFHVGCLRDYKMADLEELPVGKWFCCTECERIHLALEKLISQGEEKLPDPNLDVIRKKFDENSSESEGSVDVRWRLLCGKLDPDDTEGLLSASVAIFHEQFSPIIVAKSSRKLDHDLIPSMVKGETIMEDEYGGMYCAVLLVNHVIVSAAIIRIFGQEVAELPLVATSTKCQGKGYFQALFNCIEKLLGFLNVKNLVLPAAEEAESIWTNKFGFNKITQDELLEYRKYYKLMVFEGTSVLQKAVPVRRVGCKSESEGG